LVFAVGLALVAVAAAKPAKALQGVDPFEAYRCERAFNDGDFAKAYEICRPLAEAGLADAQFALGVMHQNGEGGVRDYRQAAIWYAKASEQGHTDAQFNLGTMYRYGIGLTQNLVEAYALFDLAAASGHAEAAAARDLAAKRMSAAQVTAARARVAELGKGPAKAVAAPAPTREMVAEAQRGLAELGYDPGPADGVAGERTRNAIRAFQAKQGLAVDGAVSEPLLAALDRALEARTTAQAPAATQPWKEPRRAQRREVPPEADTRTQELVDNLRALVRRAESERSADPRLLQQLRDLAHRYDWPWRVALLVDDFADGDYTANPAWRVAAGEFHVEPRIGLRTRFTPPARTTAPASRGGGDVAAQLFGAIIGEIARQKGGERQAQPGAAEIHSALAVGNAFALKVEMAALGTAPGGGVTIGVYQGAERSAGYRLAYSPGQQPSLELLRTFAGGSAVIDRQGLASGLEDGNVHVLEWRRGVDGEMAVLLDGRETLRTVDRRFGGAFDGVTVVNRGGDYGFRRIAIFGTGG
ncbi:MAG: peptidoglycan-binding protein, partial [Alphaproteobacteria bacterium]